jgi:hypothetical protein
MSNQKHCYEMKRKIEEKFKDFMKKNVIKVQPIV